MVKKVSEWPRESVPHDNLMFDRKNPRLQLGTDENMNQERLYNLLIRDFDVKRLAEQIKSDGFHNSEILIVVKEGDDLIVLDGNRRLAAFRYAHRQRWLNANNNVLSVTIAPSRDEADKEIIVKHIGDLKKNWTTPNQLNKLREIVGRSRDKTIEQIVEEYPSLGSELTVKRRLLNLAIYDLLLGCEWLTSQEKSQLEGRGINMINRFYTSKKGTNFFGFDIKNMTYPFDQQNLQKTVNESKSKQIVKEYILGNTSAQITQEEIADILASLSSGKSASSQKKITPRKKKRSVDRIYLVSADCVIDVKHPRVNDIYLELKGVSVDTFPNAVASLFRIFMELSLDHYMQEKSISQTQQRDGGISIKQKITLVTKHMEESKIAKRDSLKNIRRVASESDSYLCIDSFHEYMHSLNTVPVPGDMKKKWDNLKDFFEILWNDVL